MVVVLSKHFFDTRLPSTFICKQLHFYSEDCLTNLLLSFVGSAKSCAKFYLPVYIIHLLLKNTKLKRKDVENVIKMYGISIIYGALFLFGFQAPVCIYSLLFGGIDFFAIRCGMFFMPFAIFYEVRKNQVMNTMIFSNLMLESYINKFEFLGYFKRTKLNETFTFMILSGVLMYLLSKREFPSETFWFHGISPIKNPPENKCQHKENCFEYMKTGFLKYFTLGCGWNIAKSLLFNAGKLMKSRSSFSKFVFGGDHLKFGLLLGLHIAIYRYVTCQLLKKDGVRKDVHSLIGGFLAGASYFIKPNVQFAIVPFNTIVQILFERYALSYNSKSIWWYEKLPLLEMLFIATSFYLTRNYYMTIGIAPSSIESIFSVFTNKVSLHIKRQFFVNLGLRLD